MLHRAGDCNMLYENTVIMSSLSNLNTVPTRPPSNLDADRPGTGTDAVATVASPRPLLDQVHERVSYLRYSIRTKMAYVH